MAWGNNEQAERNAELAGLNAGLQKEVEMLLLLVAEKKEEIVALRDQLRWTQDALIAREAPEVYQDRREAEAIADQPEPSEEDKARALVQKKEAEILSGYINGLEKPLFKDADDMCSMLMGVTGVPIADSHSLHNNDES